MDSETVPCDGCHAGRERGVPDRVRVRPSEGFPEEDSPARGQPHGGREGGREGSARRREARAGGPGGQGTCVEQPHTTHTPAALRGEAHDVSQQKCCLLRSVGTSVGGVGGLYAEVAGTLCGQAEKSLSGCDGGGCGYDSSTCIPDKQHWSHHGVGRPQGWPPDGLPKSTESEPPRHTLPVIHKHLDVGKAPSRGCCNDLGQRRRWFSPGWRQKG